MRDRTDASFPGAGADPIRRDWPVDQLRADLAHTIRVTDQLLRGCDHELGTLRPAARLRLLRQRRLLSRERAAALEELAQLDERVEARM